MVDIARHLPRAPIKMFHPHLLELHVHLITIKEVCQLSAQENLKFDE